MELKKDKSVQKYDYSFGLKLIGDDQSGKTSLLRRYAYNAFTEKSGTIRIDSVEGLALLNMPGSYDKQVARAILKDKNGFVLFENKLFYIGKGVSFEVESENLKANISKLKYEEIKLASQEESQQIKNVLKYTRHIESISKTLDIYNRKVRIRIEDGLRGHHMFGPKFEKLGSAHSVLITIDMTNKDSIKHLHDWINDIQRYGNEKVLVAVVATKCDADLQAIDRKELEDEVKLLSESVFEPLILKFTSAKTYENIDTLCEEIVTALLKQENVDVSTLIQKETNNLEESFIEKFHLIPVENDKKYVAFETMVFDWDNTLSHQAELGDGQRHLAFPEETVFLFNTLSSLGVNIVIASQQTPAEQIQDCLERSEIANTVHKVYGSERKLDKIDVIEEIRKDFNIKSNDAICLVDDSSSTCKKAEEKGFKAIYVKDTDGLRIKTTQHLQAALHESIRFHDIDLQAVQISIARYKNKRMNHIGFFSKIFDATRGEKRANTYLELLTNEASTPFKRLVVMFSLLSSHDGENLQKCVYQSMGFKDLDTARNYFKYEIKEHLSKVHTEEDTYNSALKNLNENVIAKIVKFANSDTDLEKNKAKDFFENFSLLEGNIDSTNTNTQTI